MIKNVVTVLQVQAQAKGLELKLFIDSPVPTMVQTDPTRLRQIATKLIGNTIKFTERGGVQVRLALLAENAAPLYSLQVVDAGVSIATNKLDGICEPFVQADTSITRHFGGTGLGLAISRRFARVLGGDIVAHSSPDSGTTFVVSFDPGPLDGVAMLSPAEALNSRDTDAAVVSTLAQTNPALHATITKFVDGLPVHFAQVQAAADLAAVAQFAHWLNGAAGTVGYSGFWQPA